MSTTRDRPSLSRREVLQATAVLCGTALAAQQPDSPAPARAVPCLFSKPLHNRKFTELPAVLGELGIDAVDLTCRPGGHVLPERVSEDLPKAHELLKAAGIRIAMITTAMTDADEAHAEAIVQTAAKLGIRYAKIGYLPYRDLKKIQETLADARAKLRDLAMLFRQHGLRAGFHNHSGMNVGAAMWDVWHLIRELPPEAIGSYFDLGHATAEGGASGWKIGMHLLMPRIIMLAVKDVRWEKDERRGWHLRWGPLGEGMVRWQDAFTQLKEAGFAGPVALHQEYSPHGPPGSEADRQTLEFIRRDWRFLRERLGEADLT
jgi:sugar phosphate isomerase/epimerase